MTAITTTNGVAVARPLKVLAGLIAKDLQMAKEAEKEAGMPYYKAAGEKLIEAKSQLDHGEFGGWCQRHFNIKPSTAGAWMRFANQNASHEAFSSYTHATRGPQPPRPREQPWHQPVKQIVNKIDNGYLERQRQKQLDDAKEYKLERDLALKIIDIGYKTLATKLHPDKGGSTEAMQRLQRAVKRLKGAI